MNAKTRRDLDKLGCATPGCDCDATELYFHPNCHQEAPTHVLYDKRTGVVKVECAECGKQVIVVQVAEDSTEWGKVAVH